MSVSITSTYPFLFVWFSRHPLHHTAVFRNGVKSCFKHLKSFEFQKLATGFLRFILIFLGGVQ